MTKRITILSWCLHLLIYVIMTQQKRYILLMSLSYAYEIIYFHYVKPFPLVKMRTCGQGDPCITFPGVLHSNIISTANVKVNISVLKCRNKMIWNRCNIFRFDGGIHTKDKGKTCIMLHAVFPPFLEWIPPSTLKHIIPNLIFQNIGILEQVGHNRSMIIRFLASALKKFKPRITGALSNNNKKSHGHCNYLCHIDRADVINCEIHDRLLLIVINIYRWQITVPVNVSSSYQYWDNASTGYNHTCALLVYSICKSWN